MEIRYFPAATGLSCLEWGQKPGSGEGGSGVPAVKYVEEGAGHEDERKPTVLK